MAGLAGEDISEERHEDTMTKAEETAFEGFEEDGIQAGAEETAVEI